VTFSVTPRLRGLMGLAGAGLIGALATGRPELVVLAAPFVLLAGVGLTLAEEPCLAASLVVEDARVLEGERLDAIITLRNEGARAIQAELTLATSPQLSIEPSGAIAVHLASGERLALTFNLRAKRWGAYAVGPLSMRARDRFGLIVYSDRFGQRLAVRAFPREQQLRELVAPRHTQPFLGSHVARQRGDGIEFADLRPFTTGDRARQINWRASARRGVTYVSERHPEHSSDVILMLDTFAEARDLAGGTLDNAVRAAASLARAHLARRDRVGVVDFGGGLRWLQPGFGTNQLYQIIDALLASDIIFSYAWRDVQSIPRRVLPPRALVVAITPLLDERAIALLVDLRTRGCDLTVIEISPVPYAPSAATRAEALARRLWQLEREVLRGRLEALGIAVARWDEDDSLAPALEGVNSFRRSARHVLPV
jgi:uncharacterized protein (DUF58 family)